MRMGLREANQSFSKAIKAVKAGKDVILTERGKPIAGLGGYQMFDSLAVDSAGHICVATLITGAVSDISPDGKSVTQYKLPDPMVTNVCFGGKDLRTAFATLSLTGKLVSFEWPRPGLKLEYLNK